MAGSQSQIKRAGSLLRANADYSDYFDDQNFSARLKQISPGDLLTVIGMDASGLRAVAQTDPAASRHMLELDLGRIVSTSQTVAHILDDLADLALALWPNWYRQDVVPGPDEVLAVWRRGADRLAATGRAPRFRRIPPRVELIQLLAAVAPAGLVLCATLDGRPSVAAAQIAALEWCAGAGASILILCPNRPPATPPFDRILYDALEVVRPAPPVVDRLIAPRDKSIFGSETEKRIRKAIHLDRELSGLFEDEITLSLGPLGPTPRVDLLWREGKVIVEIDGAEHERDPNYGADRHRDYELLVAGYLVLRLTNAEIGIDLGRSVDKIRRVVNLRRNSV